MKHPMAMTALAVLTVLSAGSLGSAAPRPVVAVRPLPAAPYAAPVYPWGINAGVYPFGYSRYGYNPGYRSGGISIGIGIGNYPRYYGAYPAPGWPYGYPSSYRSIYDPRFPSASFPDYPRTLVVPVRVAEATLPIPALADTVVLTVLTPSEDSEMLIDGAPTKTRGATRSFESPQLERGYDYAYEVTARWVENGKPLERKRTVPVRPGDRVTVDLRQP